MSVEPTVPASASLRVFMRIAVWALIGMALLPTWSDPDLWGHVRFGIDFLRDRTLPAIDPYSFTQDRPWINHEWLSEAASAAAYLSLGPFGLALLKAATIAAALVLVLGSLQRASASARAVSLVVVIWAALGITLTVRPQIWTFLLTAILCRILLAATLPAIACVPLIFLLWANLHGGWIVGLGILWAFTSGACASRKDPSQCTRLVAASVCSTTITLVNPYGWRLWAFVGSTVRLSRSDIVEWQPLWATGTGDWVPWVVTMAAVAFMAARLRKPSMSGPSAVSAMLAYASLRVARLTPFFALASAILWSPYLSTLWPATPARRQQRGPQVFGAALLLVIAGAVASVAVPTARCLPITGAWSPDRSAAAALKAANAQGKLLTWFGWGEYALWHLSPNIKISIDGRRETLYSEDVVRRHVAIYEDRSEGFLYIERWHPDYVWLPVQLTSTKTWLLAHGYRIDINTPRSYIAVKEGLPRISPAPEPGRSCFPG